MFLVLAQAEKVPAISWHRMANSSTKRSCTKRNSLPSTKRFDFTMVDEDFGELQLGFAQKETNADTKKCVYKDWASARNHHSCLTWMIFSSLTPCCNSLKPSSTLVLSNRLAGAGCCLCYENAWKTWPFYVDSLVGTNCKSATHKPHIQQFKLPAHFQGGYFW